MKEIPVTINLTADELHFLVQLLEPISYSKEIEVPKQYDVNRESIYQRFAIASREISADRSIQVKLLGG
ncbi:MAG: hypothetical protein HC778_01170 [Chamaesiphon sp. CSU_1_12]|nr:hypothetical protein [Chamaesiphon sp. CSU_1_12]